MYTLAKYKAVVSLAFVFALGAMLAPQFAGAQGYDATDPFGIKPIEESGQGNIALGQADLRVVATDIINIALGLLGIVSVVIILWGGFRWMTAGGSDEKVGEARKIIFSGIIGLAIVLSAWAIARFVLVQLGNATNLEGATNYNN